MRQDRPIPEELALERERAHTREVERILYRRSRIPAILAVVVTLSALISLVSLVATPPIQITSKIVSFAAGIAAGLSVTLGLMVLAIRILQQRHNRLSAVRRVLKRVYVEALYDAFAARAPGAEWS